MHTQGTILDKGAARGRTTPTLPDDAPLTPRPAPDLHEQQSVLQLGASLGLFYACTRSSALHPMLPAVAKPDRMLPSSGEGKKPLTSSWTPRASWRPTSSWTPRASWRSTSSPRASSPRASWRQPASSQPAQEHQEWHSVGERGSRKNGVGQTLQTRYERRHGLTRAAARAQRGNACVIRALSVAWRQAHLLGGHECFLLRAGSRGGRSARAQRGAVWRGGVRAQQRFVRCKWAEQRSPHRSFAKGAQNQK